MNKLPAYTIGSYPLIYINDLGHVLCNECASDYGEEYVKSEIYWEGPNYYCNYCNIKIKSAYGEKCGD